MSWWTTIVNWFNPKFKSLWSLIKKIISGAIEIMLDEMKAYALEIVAELAVTDLTNEEKRKEAFNKIKARFPDYKDSIINLIIELALQAFKRGIE